MNLETGFLLKKTLASIVTPLPIGLILGFIGLWYLYKGYHKKSKIFLTIALLWIGAISYSPFTNLLLEPLENKYKRLEEIPKNIKYILLLGGEKESRAWEALRLYHNIPHVKIITSGYAPFGSKVPSAIKTAKFLQKVGVKKEDIIIQSKPKTTEEEAIEIKIRLGDEPFVLVTSAYHMPRAMRLFKKYDLKPIPAPTDFKIKSYDTLFSLPKGKKLLQTDQAWHEHLGVFWNWLGELFKKN
jgi:uncharacterized SAM-binding protein YcdF (DUF218 family)